MIGKRIKQFRTQKGMSQDALAKASGVTFTTITKLEIGVIKNPASDKIAKIAEALEVSMSDLMGMKMSAGRVNIAGIKAQVWAAASMFFQFVGTNTFKEIELEAALFEDFNIIFADGRRLIVEVKNRKEAFNIADLKEVYEKLLKKGGIKEGDEILIIAKNLTNEFRSLISHYSFLPKRFGNILEKHGLDKGKFLELIPRTKFWHVDFGREEAKKVALYMFSRLIDFGAPLDDINTLFNNILVEEFFEGSAKGNTYTKADFFRRLEEEKIKVVKKDGRFDSLKRSLDEQYKDLQEECNKVKENRQSVIFAENAITAASTNPTIMLYALNKLEAIDNLDLSLVEPILNLNKNYPYSFAIGRILLKNLNSESNIQIVLSYLKENISPLLFIRGDWFWVSDVVEIIQKIISFDPHYIEQVAPLISEVVEKSQLNYLYIQTTAHSFEIGKLINLIQETFKFASDLTKEKLFILIIHNFSVTNQSDDLDFHDKHGAFNIIRQYLDHRHKGDWLGGLDLLVRVLTEDYQNGYKRFGSRVKFNGYELMGGIRSWVEDHFSVPDKEFIANLLTPFLNDFYKADQVVFWQWVISIFRKKVTKNNPDYLKRAIVPILLTEYFNPKSPKQTESFNYLSELILDKHTLPSKAELLFQYINNGEYNPKLVWRLLEISFHVSEIPQNPFVEKIVRMLVESTDSEVSELATQKLELWLQNPDFLKSAVWDVNVPGSIAALSKKSLPKSVEALKRLVSGGHINQFEDHNVYNYAQQVQDVLKRNFREGKEILDLLINKSHLTDNEQILLMHSIHSIGQKEEHDLDYVQAIYEEVITPFLEKYKTSKLLFERIPNARAREVFVDFADTIARKENFPDRVTKALAILNRFLDDPDPYLPGKDKSDPDAQYSGHKRILEGNSDPSISSIRGKVAYALGFCITADSPQSVKKLVDMSEKLIGDDNYLVLNLLGLTLERLGMCRLWTTAKGSEELFLSKDTLTALRLAKRIENLAFKYLERITLVPGSAQKALALSAAHAFYHIRALSISDVNKLFDFIENLDTSVIHNFVEYYIFFAFHRKEQYKNWKHKAKGLYDDLSPEQYDDELFFKRLIRATRGFGIYFQARIIHMLPDLLKKVPNQRTKIDSLINVLLEDFSVEKFGDIFRFVEELLEINFDLAYQVYLKALTIQRDYLRGLNDQEKSKVGRINYLYAIDKILIAIYENKGEDVLVEALELAYDLPDSVYVYVYQLKEIDNLLMKLKRTERAIKVFKILYEKVDSRYFDMYNEWKENASK